MGAAYGRGFTGARYGAGSERRAEAAREKVMLGFDYLERELGSNDYLVADRFTVADLTAAALLYPVVLPAEGPFHLEVLPEGWRRLRKTVEGRPGFRWVEKMFARHRKSSPASRQSSPLAA
jgi:glutathione S-transferase